MLIKLPKPQDGCVTIVTIPAATYILQLIDVATVQYTPARLDSWY